MNELSPLDATFLELEQADRSAHMHIGGMLVFDPLPDGGAPSLEIVRTRLEERLGALPRYRQRLSRPQAGPLRWPHWEEDPTFDLDAHVRRAALPAPGGDRELLEWAGDFFSHRLDRGLPLWKAVILEGLRGARWAVVTKTHHCLVDGIGAVDAGTVLFDDPPPLPPIGSPADSRHGLLSTAFDLVRQPRRSLERIASMAELLVRDELAAAPRTSLNAPIGEHRRIEIVRARLADLKTIGSTLGGTVNDVVLASVAGGLRELLLARDEEPPAGLRAMVPVSLRTAGRHVTLGNRVSSLFVGLPVDEPDPVVRLERVTQETAARKRAGEAQAPSDAIALGALAPPVLHAVLAQTRFATRLFNVTVTNVPGPSRPLRAFGAPVREAIPFVPLAAEHAVGVAVLSYAGRVVFALCCDRDSVPDASVAARAIRSSLAALRAASRAASPA